MVKCCMTCIFFDYLHVKCKKRENNAIIPHDHPLPCPDWIDEEKEEKNNGQTRGR